MKPLIVFDVDGTIVNSFDAYLHAVEIYSREKGYRIPCLETIRVGYGTPEDYDFKWGCPREEQKARLMESYSYAADLLRGQCPSVTSPLFEGVKETLEAFKDAGYQLAIATSKYEEALLQVLKHHRLEHFFSGYRAHEDIHRRREREKPFPDQLLSLVKELGGDLETTVMIGDTTMDMHMGKSARSRAVGVGWGNHDASMLRAAGADSVIETAFKDLLPAVQHILSKSVVEQPVTRRLKSL